MGLIDCPETSVRKDCYALYNVPEERRSYFLLGVIFAFQNVINLLVLELNGLVYSGGGNGHLTGNCHIAFSG
jgi:hypothetical protein